MTLQTHVALPATDTTVLWWEKHQRLVHIHKCKFIHLWWPQGNNGAWGKAGSLGSWHRLYISVQFSSAAQSCPTLCANLWNAACQASLSITNSQSLPKLMSIELVMSSNHLIPCHPLFLPAFNLSQHQGLFK